MRAMDERVMRVLGGVSGRPTALSDVVQMRTVAPDLIARAEALARAPDWGTAQGYFTEKVQDRPEGDPLDGLRMIFLHIPKCGGTTLHHKLRGWVKGDSVNPERFNNLYDYPLGDFTRYRLVSGHYDFASVRSAPPEFLRVTFLRDPVARLVSLYNFLRAHSAAFCEERGLGLALKARALDIDGFFADAEVREMAEIDNAMVRNFSNRPQPGGRWEIGHLSETVVTKLMRDEAVTNLRSFDFVGLVETYDQSLADLAALVDRAAPVRVERGMELNRIVEEVPHLEKHPPQKPSDKTLTLMAPLVKHDRILYQAARDRARGTAAEARTLTRRVKGLLLRHGIARFD